MNAKRRNITYSDFYCTICESKITLPRKRHKQREKGHIKDIHCIKCKRVTKHTEIRFQDLMITENVS